MEPTGHAPLFIFITSYTVTHDRVIYNYSTFSEKFQFYKIYFDEALLVLVTIDNFVIFPRSYPRKSIYLGKFEEEDENEEDLSIVNKN